MEWLRLHIEYLGGNDKSTDMCAVVLEGEIDGQGFLENLFEGSFKECLEYEAGI